MKNFIKIFVVLFHKVYKQKLKKYLQLYCKGKILDIGCGDLCLTNTTKLDIRSVESADIVGDAEFLPFKNKTFDTTVVSDVLHHCKNIDNKIDEIKRVTKKRIIIKDHCFYSKLSFFIICFCDWITNFIYHIKCNYNFLSRQQWYKLFKENNLNLIEEPKKLNFGFFLNERYNPIFILKIE